MIIFVLLIWKKRCALQAIDAREDAKERESEQSHQRRSESMFIRVIVQSVRLF